MLVAFSISPMSSDPAGSVTEAVAAAVRVVRESGLPHETNAMFTNIEGEWDEVMAVVKRAVDVVAEVSPRVGLVLNADGFGSPEGKRSKYGELAPREHPPYPGFKLFYEEDTNLMSPGQVLDLNPRPRFIAYE